jgi:hypothetical protein
MKNLANPAVTAFCQKKIREKRFYSKRNGYSNHSLNGYCIMVNASAVESALKAIEGKALSVRS